MYWAGRFRKQLECDENIIDDLKQVGHMALRNTSNYFQPGGDAKFVIYAPSCI